MQTHGCSSVQTSAQEPATARSAAEIVVKPDRTDYLYQYVDGVRLIATIWRWTAGDLASENIHLSLRLGAFDFQHGLNVESARAMGEALLAACDDLQAAAKVAA